MSVTWEKIQTGLIVTVIAVLVWLYAEGQAVTEQPKQVELSFVSPGDRQLAISPERVSVTATFSASASQMRRVEAVLRQGPLQVPVRLPTGPTAYEQAMPIRDLLLATTLGQLGVNITDTAPLARTVRVEPLVTHEAPVRVEVEPGYHVQRPRVEPRTARVTVPVSLADLAQRQAVVVPLTDLGTFEVDAEQTLEVPLELPAVLRGRPWVRLEPGSAHVTFTITRQTDTVTLTRVPIEISVSPVRLRDFEIDIADEDLVLHDVELSGPADVIERVRNKELGVWASLRPTLDELEAQVTSLQVELMNVPASVTVESTLPRVPVEVRRRE
ncbi:MAG: hypothetical protein WD009_09465 [Phycisphaeraceae bacterium]